MKQWPRHTLPFHGQVRARRSVVEIRSTRQGPRAGQNISAAALSWAVAALAQISALRQDSRSAIGLWTSYAAWDVHAGVHAMHSARTKRCVGCCARPSCSAAMARKLQIAGALPDVESRPFECGRASTPTAKQQAKTLSSPRYWRLDRCAVSLYLIFMSALVCIVVLITLSRLTVCSPSPRVPAGLR